MSYPYKTGEQSLSLVSGQTVRIVHPLNTIPKGNRFKRYKSVMEGTFTWVGTGLSNIAAESTSRMFAQVKHSLVNGNHKCDLTGPELIQKYTQDEAERWGHDLQAPGGGPVTSEERIAIPVEFLPKMGGDLDWDMRVPTDLVRNDAIEVNYSLPAALADLVSFSGTCYLEPDLDYFDEGYVESKTELKSVSTIASNELEVSGRLAVLLVRNRAFTNVTMRDLYEDATPADLDRISEKHWTPYRQGVERFSAFDDLRATLGYSTGGVGGDLAFSCLFDRRDHKLFDGDAHFKFTGLASGNAGYIIHRYENLV